MEPVNRAAELSDNLREAVVALDVRELVEQYDSAAIVVPPIRARRQNYYRPNHAPGRRHYCGPAREQSNAATETQLVSNILCEPVPFIALDESCIARKSPECKNAAGNGNQSRCKPADPDESK